MSQNITLESVDKEAANGFTLNNSVFRTEEDSVIHGSNGLLFYRGLTRDLNDVGQGNKATDSHILNILTHFDVNHIAIGHTLVKNIGFDYGGKVLRTDVDHAGGDSEALLFQTGEFWRVDLMGHKFPLSDAVNYSN